MTKCPSYGNDLRSGRLSDDVIKTVADVSLPLGLPPTGTVIGILNGNRATWKPNTTDTRVVQYGILALKRTDPATRVMFPATLTGLPGTARLFYEKALALNDHSDATRNLAAQKTDYYVFPTFRDFSPTSPPSALWLGFV